MNNQIQTHVRRLLQLPRPQHSVIPRFRHGRDYSPNDVVEHEGSTWIATEPTRAEPGISRKWDLMASKGERGEAGAAGRGPRGFAGITTVITTTGDTPTAFVADETISAGQVLRVSGDGHCMLANASVVVTAEAIGLSVVDVASSAAGLLKSGGTLTLDDWSAVTGSASLSPGYGYYLSLTDGMLSTDPPTGEGKCVVFIGRATDAQTLLIEVAAPVVLSE